ncbi:tyrosine-type recombinase/integrase [Janthinobacterium sp. LB3P118]|uniref:tyrosine-type recombinase/integrase n=1 Tax=Janthinobacterium sp. LB3P118 TaxID=3424195 RepID=UPI003F262B26
MEHHAKFFGQPTPWNKGKLVGQKAPLRISEIWAIRVCLEIYRRVRDLALFNLAIDRKLRGCDLVQLSVNDVCQGGHIAARAIVMQQKTKRPVQFELTAGTRKSLGEWIAAAAFRHGDFLFSSRISESPHISTKQYARIVHQWFDEIGLDSMAYSTQTMRRTKPTLIYRRTKNLRAVQLLLGHMRLESTVRYLGIEVDDALEMAEKTDALEQKRRQQSPRSGRFRSPGLLMNWNPVVVLD